MKRWLPLGIILVLMLVLSIKLSDKIAAPDAYTGAWYSSGEGNLYIFREGILVSDSHYIPVSEGVHVSGAYCFDKDSIAVFAVGVDGLERVEELYLIKGRNGNALCGNRDGSGPVFFYRSKTDAIQNQD